MYAGRGGAKNMAKYRIKETVDFSGAIVYTPQQKSFFGWYGFDSAPFVDVTFDDYEKCRAWLSNIRRMDHQKTIFYYL